MFGGKRRAAARPAASHSSGGTAGVHETTHDRWIGQIGYHIRDYFLRQMDAFNAVPRGVLAHSTHVRGTGALENGVEKPRIQVVYIEGAATMSNRAR